ncbi:uncharacterized protein WM277_022125 [Molossus nigricans]
MLGLFWQREEIAALPAAETQTHASPGWRTLRWRKSTAEDSPSLPRLQFPGPRGGLRRPLQAQLCLEEQDPPKGPEAAEEKREAASPNARVRRLGPVAPLQRSLRRRQLPLLPAARTNQSLLRGTGK